MDHANWSFPTNIRFGSGRKKEIKSCCDELKICKPLIVTDKNLVNSEMFADFQSAVSNAGLEYNVFSEVDANPNEDNLNNGLKYLRDKNNDGILAIGGGSAIDLAKLMAFMHVQERPVWDFEDREDWWTRASSSKALPVVALPTTAGTGAEVGRASVLTHSASLTKRIIFHPSILPDLVILDPDLTTTMPPEITAGTGMDALAHNLEAYCSERLHPMSQGIALEGIRIVLNNLLLAYSNPSNLEARGSMMISATMGAVAFQKGLGAIHAISHPIGALYGCHHGTTNAILINPVLKLNKPVIERKIEAACRYINFSESFESFCSKIDELNLALNIPKNLKSLGVREQDIESITEKALKDPSSSTNPLVLNKDNLTKVIRLAM